ncbi:3-phosphoserine/phosphohydroxythreonine transaminase [Liquorilactobacillus ghanensis]|uniref:3-phosphoserine/phosphohydroxythreonine transaminase n=1 Tax=Liquorilactobacillus ghanensis TaxID=399370 RepID=UPI0039E9C16B
MPQVYNFAAGPAVLPAEVIKQVQQELTSYQKSGMSILEISHRSSLFTDLQAAAENDLRRLMRIPTDYDVLFLQGGATLQFTMTALNLAKKSGKIAFVDTGHWSQRAIQEAKLLPKVVPEIIASGKENHFTAIPKVPKITADYDYVHLTVNNTIEGTMYHQLPAALNNQTIVADMSSIILGYDYQVTDFDLIYAGAQKNIGPAGLTVVILKHALLSGIPTLPAMLSYPKQVKKHSALNTPPVFAIYTAGLVFKWLLRQGGVSAMQQQNEIKAQLLYNEIANSSLYRSPVAVADRSLTNIPFVTGSDQLDAEFVADAQAAGLMNLKGHRLVGGMRASLYNAMPLAGVKRLVEFMQQFEMNHGGSRK